MDHQKIVIRYNDRRVIKGSTLNFSPTSRYFHLIPHGQAEESHVTVDTATLKAIFFVRTFEGDPTREDRNHFLPGDQYGGSQVEVSFSDGEKLAGTTPNYDQSAIGFFVFPVDKRSNTIKVFAVNSSVVSVNFIKTKAKPVASIAAVPKSDASQKLPPKVTTEQQCGKVCIPPVNRSNAQFNQSRKSFIRKVLDMLK